MGALMGALMGADLMGALMGADLMGALMVMVI